MYVEALGGYGPLYLGPQKEVSELVIREWGLEDWRLKEGAGPLPTSETSCSTQVNAEPPRLD